MTCWDCRHIATHPLPLLRCVWEVLTSRKRVRRSLCGTRREGVPFLDEKSLHLIFLWGWFEFPNANVCSVRWLSGLMRSMSLARDSISVGLVSSESSELLESLILLK